MARRRPSPSTGSRSTSSKQQYATRREFEAVLAIIERNTTRIERLEDVFAMHAKERSQVKQELAAMKEVLKDRRPAPKRRR